LGFYTNVSLRGNKVLYRGFRKGKRVQESVEYNPSLFVSTSKPTNYKTLDGKFVELFRPGTIRDCRNFVQQYENVSGFEIYGNTDYVYQFIGDLFKEEVEYDPSLVRIAYLDIETTCERGFPDVNNPIEQVTVITIRVCGETHVFGLGEYTIDDSSAHCHHFTDESDLLRQFIQIWKDLDPDIVTGWNVKFFDIAYLYSRMRELIGTKEANKLSPWGYVREHTVRTLHGEKLAFDLTGIATLDYLDLYQTFTYTNQESYKLDHIASVELGEGKLSYDEYDSISDFYKKDFPKFVQYNYQDTILIEKLEEKMKLLELALALAYTAKVNLVDVFSQVRTWDQIIYHHLRSEGIVIPMKKRGSKSEQYAGAYVKEPITGMNDWVVSFDLNSLYPHLIMQYNISPETKIDFGEEKERTCSFGGEPYKMRDGHQISVDNILYENVKCMEDIQARKTAGLSVAASGTCYRKDVQGFLPALMEKMYKERKMYKTKMIECQKRQQAGENLDNDIAKYNNFQLVRKIQLNSAYGAIGNQWFRYYDVDLATSITLSGQLAIRWIANKLNEFLNKTIGTEEYDYVVASDTDSVYLRLGNLVDKICPNKTKSEVVGFLDKAAEEIILPFIRKQYDQLAKMTNAYENKMVMERECISDKAIWTAKKRYIMNVYDNEGVRYTKPKMKIMGIETTRSSTPQIVREKLKTAISLIVTGTEDELIGFVSDFKGEFMNMPVENVAFPRSCNNLEKYRDETHIWKKSTPIAVKGALVYNHFIKDWGLTSKYVTIQEGEKIKFVNLKDQNPFGCNVISFSTSAPKEFELEKYADYRKQFQTSFIDPLSVILSHTDWHYERKAVLF
jgi:DNA polymerase elongation subunit (family B)